jgi:predicted nucleic acid-binding protein
VTRPVVVDTNILFSALLKERSGFAETLLTSGVRFYVNELVLAEIFRHKEKLVRLSTLSEAEIVRLLHTLLRAVEIFKEDLISSENRRAAYELCRDVDETDAPHVAIALELDALLWTGDATLKSALRAKGFDRFFTPGPLPRPEPDEQA